MKTSVESDTYRPIYNFHSYRLLYAVYIGLSARYLNENDYVLYKVNRF